MRLIDADEFENDIVENITVKAVSRMLAITQGQPTVKAIPIELYEQVKGERDVAVEQLKSLNIELFEKPYRKAITIEWIENKLKCCDNINAEIFVKSLIRDWGKENDFATNSRVGNRCNGDNDSNISSTTNSGIYKESITR